MDWVSFVHESRQELPVNAYLYYYCGNPSVSAPVGMRPDLVSDINTRQRTTGRTWLGTERLRPPLLSIFFLLYSSPSPLMARTYEIHGV
jgi:hypothetical protein